MTREWRIAAAATFGVALILTFPGFLPGRVLLPLDHPRDQGVWKPDPNARYEISNKILSDPIYEFHAWDIEIRRLLAHGQMPWRNRWAGDGAHLYANPEAALFFPFTWARLVLGDRGWVLMAFLKLWAGGLGMWWFARLLGAEWRLGLVASTVYAASGYMTVWLLFAHTNVFATMPWFAACALQFVREPSRSAAIGVIATSVLATAGGHPETLFHGVLAIALFLILVTRPRRRLVAVAILALTGFLMMAVQLVPFGVALAKSDIVQTRREAKPVRIRVFAVAAQLLPGFLGSPLRGELDLSGISQPAAENFNERTAGYAGGITLIVIAMAWRRLSRDIRVGMLIGIATLLVAWNVPVITQIIRSLPLFNIAANERFPLVFAFFASAALPSAIAIVASGAPRQKLGLVLGGILITIALGAALPALPAGRTLLAAAARSGIGVMQRREFLRKPSGYYEQRLHHYLDGLRVVAVRRIALPIALAGCAAIAIAATRRRTALLTSVIAIEMFGFAWGYSPAVHRRDAAPTPRAIEEIRRADPGSQFFIAASENVYDANLGTIHQVRDIRSYDVLQEHGRIQHLVQLGYDRNSRAFPAVFAAESAAQLAREGVRFVLSRNPVIGAVQIAGALPPAVGVYELPNAIPAREPSKARPRGVAVGAIISVTAVLAAIAQMLLLRRNQR